MIGLKKAALAVIALGMTGVASAAMYAPPPAAGCTDGSNVTVPCEKQGWSAAIDALYVQTNNVGQVAYDVTTTTGTTNVNYNNAASDWQWGWNVALAYYFGTGNDVNVNWTHFEKDSMASLAGTDIEGMYVANVILGGNDANNVATDVDNDFNSINAEFGQMVHFGEHVDTRFHAGIQYASIEQNLDQSVWNSSNNTIYDENNIQSNFHGLGPRFGADTAYNFGNGLSLFGDVAAAVLVGDISYNSTEVFTAANGTGTTAATVNVSSESDNAVVPEVEAKLGVRYVTALAQGDLSFEVGYEAVNYFDALSTSGTDINTTSNFGYDGVFFGVKWLGNV